MRGIEQTGRGELHIEILEKRGYLDRKRERKGENVAERRLPTSKEAVVVVDFWRRGSGSQLAQQTGLLLEQHRSRTGSINVL